MIIKYEYNGEIYKFQCIDIKKAEAALKVSVKRKLGISINEYLSHLGHDIEPCRVCKIGNPPVVINYSINSDLIVIEGFKYKKEVYCYGDNKDCIGIKMNPNSFEFISLVKNISIEEAKIFLKNNNKSPFYKENHEDIDSYKNFQSRSLSSYIDRYGKELGTNKYEDHISKISISNTLDGYILKYGNDMGREMFESISKKKDSMSLSYFIKKNNGDYQDAISEFENRKKSVNNSVENLINKYGKEIAIEKHKNRVNKYKNTYNLNPMKEEINKSKAITIENLLRKYGSIEKANEVYDKWRKSVCVPICVASKESLKIFNPLIDIVISDFKIENNDIYIGNGESKEFFIKDNNDIYFYDFTIRSKKIIIEYNGVIFHPKNEKSDWKSVFNPNITAKMVYDKQKYKIDLAKNNGFNVLEIWSDDEHNLKKCIEFIKNIIKYDS